MDKLKTRVLFIALIILALVSVSAVAAADVDDVVSVEQDDIDLSEETVSNVEEVNDDSNVLSGAASSDILAADGEEEPSYTYIIGYQQYSTLKNATGSSKSGWTVTSKWLHQRTSIKPMEFDSDGFHWVFNHWEEVVEDGDNVVVDDDYSVKLGPPSTVYTRHYVAVYDKEKLPDYTYIVDYKSSLSETGNVTSTKSHYNGWTITLKWFNTFGVKPTNPNSYNFTYKDVRYVFNHWEEVVEDGDNVVVDDDYSVKLGPPSTVYTRHYIAVYDEILPGNLTVNNIDPIAHGSHSWSCSADNVNYTHTYKTPADIPNAAVFLYWEREDTGDKFNEGDKLTVTVDEYKDKTLVINVYAVYDIKTSIELEEITGYVGDTADITAIITEDLTNKAVPGGTATLTIDYANKLSNGLLGASTYTDTVEVDADGKAVFKDVKLENPGTYKYTVTYSRYNYNHHEEGINDYLPSEADSKLNILPLNTTTTSEDVSGTVGDKKDITTDIVDQNGDPVQNGTAVLKVNGKEYTAEVKDGKAVFKDVELTENTTATIEYLGNDYYNPSNTTIEITVTAPEEPEEPAEEPSDDPEEPADEPEEEPSTPVAEKAIPIIPATGNPIALVILALLTLVSTVSLGNKK